MTPRQFRASHGDTTNWTPADFDSYQVITENTRKHRVLFRIRNLRRAVRRSLHLAA